MKTAMYPQNSIPGEFPNFLRIAALAETEPIQINETLRVNKPKYVTSNEIFIDILSEVLGFTYTLVAPTDGAFGSILPGGNWSGMVGLVEQEKADIIVNYLSITEERCHVVDFSFPYYIDRVVFATNKLQRSISATSFLKPFSPDVWICLALSILSLPIIFYFFYHRGRPLRFLYAGEMFTERSLRYPGNAGKAFIKSFWMIAETLMNWSYVAVLLSFLTLPSFSGIRTIAELGNAVKEGKYQCITNPGSYVPDALILSGGHLKVIGENLKKIEGSNDIQKTLKTKSFKKLAFIASETNLLTYKSNFFISNDGMFPDMMAIAVRKDFCCKAHLDLTIQRIWASDIFYHVLEEDEFTKMYKVNEKSASEESGKRVESLGISDFLGLFTLLGIGHVLAIVVFFLELSIARKRRA